MNQPTTMNELLAAHYGTNGQTKVASAPSPEDLEKAAQMDLFAKMAAANNIDVSKLTDAQIEQLYNDTFSKQAELPPQFAAHVKGKEDGKGDGDKDEKKDLEEKAKKEHEEKKAASEKIAEAETLGRVMAHSFVAEMKKIAADAAEKEKEEKEKEHKPEHEKEKEKEAAMPAALLKGLEHAKGHAGKAMEHAAKHPGATHGAAAAGGAAAGAAAMHHHKKASAIDTLALEVAVHMAHDAGLDAEVAGQKVAAVMALGLLGESEKVASAANVETAVQIRALEFLEKAGYSVIWQQ